MSTFFIKKEDGVYKFAFEAHYSTNKRHQLCSYKPSEQYFQYIKNENGNNYFVVFDSSHPRFLNYAKMVLEEKLHNKEGIDYLFLNNEVVPALKKSAKSVYLLRKDDEESTRMPLSIYIFNKDKGYSISQYFFVQELIESFDDRVTFEALHASKKWTFREFLNKAIEMDKIYENSFCYPLSFGSTNKSKIKVLDSDNKFKYIDLEEFICHY